MFEVWNCSALLKGSFAPVTRCAENVSMARNVSANLSQSISDLDTRTRRWSPVQEVYHASTSCQTVNLQMFGSQTVSRLQSQSHVIAQIAIKEIWMRSPHWALLITARFYDTAITATILTFVFATVARILVHFARLCGCNHILGLPLAVPRWRLSRPPLASSACSGRALGGGRRTATGCPASGPAPAGTARTASARPPTASARTAPRRGPPTTWPLLAPAHCHCDTGRGSGR